MKFVVKIEYMSGGRGAIVCETANEVGQAAIDAFRFVNIDPSSTKDVPVRVTVEIFQEFEHHA